MADTVTLAEAVRELVHDGDTVALEGFTHLIPNAAGHELIRQGLRDLTLVRMTPDVIYDQLIGMGAARKLVFSWGGNPGVGSLHRLRDAVEHGWPAPLELEEHSHAGMAAAYAAGAANLPFGVLRGYAGNDLVARTRVATITCPFTGEELAAVPAHRPDVGIIHAQQADRHGNVQLWGITGVQKEAVLASSRSIVTVEEIVDELEPRAGRGRAARLGDRRGGGGARRRAPVLRARLLRARQRVLRRLGRDQPRPRHVHRAGCRSTCSRPSRRDVHLRRDDGRRGRAAAHERHRLLRRDRAPQPGREPRARGPTRPTACSSTRAERSARSRTKLPLSIGDGELAETADAVVSVPEMFAYWLQAGRIDVGFLGAAQIDRYGNLNSTVIGDYATPKVRLPGGGGAPEIATSVADVFVMLAPDAARVRRAARLQDEPRRPRPRRSSPTSGCSSRATAS